MVTAGGDVSVEQRRRAAIVVEDSDLEHVITTLVNGQQGWRVCRNRASADLVVADSPDAGVEAPVILLLEGTATMAARALASVSEGAATGALLASNPAAIVPALDSVTAGLCVVDARVVDLARQFPKLSSRQISVLRGVRAGFSNAEIAATTHVSEATVKREIQELLETLDAPNRVRLAVVAHDLGVSSPT